MDNYVLIGWIVDINWFFKVVFKRNKLCDIWHQEELPGKMESEVAISDVPLFYYSVLLYFFKKNYFVLPK